MVRLTRHAEESLCREILCIAQDEKDGPVQPQNVSTSSFTVCFMKSRFLQISAPDTLLKLYVAIEEDLKALHP